MGKKKENLKDPEVLTRQIKNTCKNVHVMKTATGYEIDILKVAEDYEFSLMLDSKQIVAMVRTPLVKERQIFSLEKSEVLVSPCYLEVYEGENRFIHLDFADNNFKMEEQAVIQHKTRQKTLF